MSGRLQDKVALVVGAGASGPGWGNGKATAVLFAREGAKVFAVDRNPVAAAETCSIIAADRGQAIAHTADVTDTGQVAAMVDVCLKAYGRIDILQHNVGITALGGPVELAEADWDRVMAVNLRSLYLTSKHVLPAMQRQGKGAIVTVSSIASLRWLGYPAAVYGASKGAVNQLTQSIALQYAAEGIRANAILPGLMDTPMIVEPLKDAYGEGGVETMRQKRNAQVPTGKMGDAWDVAYAALYLASDEAKYVTGHMLVVDGGLTCKFA